MAVYELCTQYIGCARNTKEEIVRINAVIRALEDSMIENGYKSNLQEYSLDDGQTKIKSVFRSIESIEQAITGLERRKQRLINRCVGYRYGLQDGKTLR